MCLQMLEMLSDIKFERELGSGKSLGKGGGFLYTYRCMRWKRRVEAENPLLKTEVCRKTRGWFAI